MTLEGYKKKSDKSKKDWQHKMKNQDKHWTNYKNSYNSKRKNKVS